MVLSREVSFLSASLFHEHLGEGPCASVRLCGGMNANHMNARGCGSDPVRMRNADTLAARATQTLVVKLCSNLRTIHVRKE